MTTPSSRYQLSCELVPPHSDDVKAVLAINDDLLASASRDSSVAIWKRTEHNQFNLAGLLNGHHAYVNSLAHIPANSDEEDLLASGGNSSLILLHSLSALDSESRACLIGHTLNVCALNYSQTRRKLISGSWDQTARVWSRESGEWNCDLILEGHDQAVWGVAIVEEGPKEGHYLTADRLINLWNTNGELLLRIKGSPEPVRSLTMLPGGDTFASACNDGLIRIWDLSGSVLYTLRGHTDYAYHIALGPDGGLLSCGEDHTVRLWKDQSEYAVMLHPCQTVWSTSALPNGDVISGGSDGKVRVWSSAMERFAEEGIRNTYERQVTDAMPNDDAPAIPLVYSLDSDPRTAAEEFGRDYSLSDNYINQIEAFIKAHLEVARDG
nr:uncharacterized protein CI109_002258 [Kwoniella shandongensis]KAA5529365.1 hypothetical protein CI109_002258 [Kwoniella shandongensis]